MEKNLANNKVSFLIQFIRELWYLILVMILFYIVGIFYSLKPYERGTRRPIVLVTGFWGRNLYWKKFKNKLIKSGFSVYPINLHFQVGDIRKKSKLLEEYLIKHDIKDCYMIAHSMGGWIALGLSDEAKKRIKKMFTLSISFRGTYVVYTVPMFICSWQMHPGSKFAETQKENLKYLKHVKNIHVLEDEIAVPVETSVLGIEEEICFHEFGHLNLVMSDAGTDFLVEQIELEEKNNNSKTKELSFQQ